MGEKVSKISVIIPTYNRKVLLDRCLKSIYKQRSDIDEIIIVDDASTDGTDEFIKSNYPDCKYYKLEENKGVCCARNYGIDMCKSKYALLLDSDDSLLDNIVPSSMKEIGNLTEQNREYSIYFFLRNSARLKDESIRILQVEHVLRHYVIGNTTEIVNIKKFKKNGYRFPEDVSRVGGEQFLWLEISKKEGIPIFNKVITVEHDDADNRLTSPYSQLDKARYHAILQEQTINGYRDLYMKYDKIELQKRINACSIYWKLCGEEKKAFYWAIGGIKLKLTINSIIALLFVFFPVPAAKWIFIKWRSATL